jgi:hypothetical protein
MSWGNNATSFLLFGVLRQRKLQPAAKCAAYNSEPVPVLTNKWNISTKQSACQHIYFILLPYSSKIICPWYKQLPPPSRMGASHRLRISGTVTDNFMFCLHLHSTRRNLCLCKRVVKPAIQMLRKMLGTQMRWAGLRSRCKATDIVISWRHE